MSRDLNWLLILGITLVAPVVALAQEDGIPSSDSVEPQPGIVGESVGAESTHADLAYGAYQRGLYLTALELALPRANAGDAAAQTLIAELYQNGLGVAQNTKEATEWYRIAAKSGNREAQFAYGVKLMKGEDVPQDMEAGVEMMKASAKAGHSVAMFNLANHIVTERPTSAGYRKALPLFEKAAEAGVADAFYALAHIHREGLANGIQDMPKAIHWLTRAARAGIDTAQVELGIMLANGKDVPQDEAAAISWFRIAAGSGNVIARNRLAHLLLKNVQNEKTVIEAAMWHMLARRAGREDFDLDQFVASLDEETRSKALTLANRLQTGT